MPGPGTGVLYPDVTCAGMTVGSGAGFFSADISDQATIDAFLAGNPIHAAHMDLNGTGANRKLGIHFSSAANVPEGQFPNYVDGYYASHFRAQTRDAGNGSMAVDIEVFDRDQNKLVTRTATFGSCAKQ